MASRIGSRASFWPLILLVMVVAFALLMLSKPAARTSAPGQPPQERANAAEAIADLFSNKNTPRLANLRVDMEAARRFYEARRFQPAWTGKQAAKADAAVALSALVQAEENGLQTLGAGEAELLKGAEAADAPLYDVLITDAVLRYAREMRIGRVAPNTVYKDVSFPLQSFDPVPMLETSLGKGSLAAGLAALAPPHPDYQRLISALAAYRELAKGAPWPQLPAGAPELKRGDPRLALLRARLAREDRSLATEPAGGSDDDLFAALRRYQTRNGVEPDGKLGPRTLAALNIPPATRVAQIEANMERWRWLPRNFERRFVMVNAADTTLQVFDAGKIILESKVIAGAADKPTPMFRAEATELTVNPPWNVPASIARNEILPKLRRDPNYLLSQHMVLLNVPAGDPHGTRIDWKRIPAGAFPYRIQQVPGPDNALGVLKLEMPNAFNVYLHDTPGKNAFGRSDRHLSHGCVRVQDILPLASIALTGDARNAAEVLTGAIAAGETKRLRIQALPVYVVYWTVIAGADGTVQFRPDPYKRDERLIAAMRATKRPLDVVLEGCAAASFTNG